MAGNRRNTEPLMHQLRQSFGTEQFTVEAAMELTARSRFLDTHLKRMTLAAAEKAGALVVTRPAGVRQFKEGKGITMRFNQASGP